MKVHHLLLGVFADSVTFFGAAILARDAFLRLRDLQNKRTDEEFRRRFPALNLSDTEWHEAIVASWWTMSGFVLLLLGFACQLILRLTES